MWRCSICVLSAAIAWSADWLAAEPIDTALQYLTREAQVWRTQNGCFSCHNNGDAARVVSIARRSGRPLDRATLKETMDWLSQPKRWAAELADTEFKDAELAELQFAAALAEATSAELVDRPQPLAEAAELLAKRQKPDGRWSVDRSGLGGGPVTYGDALATALARGVLRSANTRKHAEPLARADRWLRAARSQSPAEQAAVVLGLAGATDEEAAAQRKKFVAAARKARTTSGGWGPFAGRPAEPFDTALVLLGLATLADEPDEPGVADLIARGRAALLAMQEPAGNWPETTRPAGGESYAHRVSTTAWATQAVLVTGARGK